MSTKLDAALNLFSQRQLEIISSTLYKTPYAADRASEIMPVNANYDPGAETITWQLLTEYGTAKIIRDYADDFPTVDAASTDNSNKVVALGASYRYSDQEMRASMMANRNVSSVKAETCRSAIMREMDSIAAIGSTDYALTGFLNATGLGSSTLTTGSAGDTWALKVGSEILADLETMYNDILSAVSDSTIALLPNSLVMPPGRAGYLKKRLSDTNMTVEEFFLSNYPEFRGNLHVWSHATTAGAAAATRSVMYRKDPTLVELAVPLPFNQDAPQKRNKSWVTNCELRTAGCIFRYPVSATYMDGM